MAFIGGKALALYGEYQTFDIMFVIDTSDSTAEPSGADIDGNGVVGEKRLREVPRGSWAASCRCPNSDKADSVLAAEIEGCRVLLKQLDPRTTRVGIVSFNGDADAMTPDAITEVPLTSDFTKVERGARHDLPQRPQGHDQHGLGGEPGDDRAAGHGERVQREARGRASA